MSPEEKTIVDEFNNASGFIAELDDLKSAGHIFNYHINKDGFHNDLVIKTDIQVEGPAMMNPTMDISINKDGKLTVYGDYDNEGGKRDTREFSAPKEAVKFVKSKLGSSI